MYSGQKQCNASQMLPGTLNLVITVGDPAAVSPTSDWLHRVLTLGGGDVKSPRERNRVDDLSVLLSQPTDWTTVAGFLQQFDYKVNMETHSRQRFWPA